MGAYNSSKSFQRAADVMRAAYDANTGPTDGSPIGAAAAEVGGWSKEDLAAVDYAEPDVASANDQSKQEAPERATVGGAVLAQLMKQAIEQYSAKVQHDAAMAEELEIVEDADDQYATARKLTAMNGINDGLADQLELEGQVDVARFVRKAGKMLRKGAALARRNALTTLTDVDESDD